jgi:enoyl-CoA hydratase
MSTSTSGVTVSVDSRIAIVTLDDGRANALSSDVLDGLGQALDRVEQEDIAAIVMAGRAGRFCAGFDLTVMRSGARERRVLVEQGAHLFLRMAEFPRPIVIACGGHALAAGAVWLTSADWRIGADVDAKIGLNEVAIGLALPIFALELARERLSKRHFLAATSQARIYTSRDAVDAGYLDEVVPAGELLAAATSKAAELGALSSAAFALTKRSAMRATIRYIRDTLEEDMDRVG